jgi:hypothetical protein
MNERWHRQWAHALGGVTMLRLQHDWPTALIMAEASRIVLAGFELSSDAHITRYPDRYRHPGGRGDKLWRDVMKLIARPKTSAAA